MEAEFRRVRYMFLVRSDHGLLESKPQPTITFCTVIVTARAGAITIQYYGRQPASIGGPKQCAMIADDRWRLLSLSCGCGVWSCIKTVFRCRSHYLRGFPNPKIIFLQSYIYFFLRKTKLPITFMKSTNSCLKRIHFLVFVY